MTAPDEPFPLAEHTIFLTLAGSRAHGTAGEGSDVDVRGICVAPAGVRLSLFTTFEQHEGPPPAALAPHIPAAPDGSKTECVLFDVAKLLHLCALANPNALEILFADEADWLVATPLWRRLHAARGMFLTRKVQQTFLGYALAQLKKIKSHRAWLLEPPARKPTREDFGLPAAARALSRDDQNRVEESLAAQLRSYRFDDVELSKPTRMELEARLTALLCDVFAAAEDELDERVRAVATHALGIPIDVVGTLNAEKRYRAALKHWESYETWKRQRNPKRAELESRFGYDTKHAMHLVRIMRMGAEILEEGVLRVRRPDAAELRALRDGALSFDALLAIATALETRMRDAAEQSRLPTDVDKGAVDDLLRELLREESWCA